MNIFTFSKPSVLLLHYGLFAILCHLCGIILFSTSLPILCTVIYTHTVFPMLEHSLLSLLIVLIGVLALEYLHKDIDKNGNK